MGRKQTHNGHMTTECEGALPLVTVTAPEYGKQNEVMWASSPDRLELPPKPFHNTNYSFSPSVLESGSDVFSKREVIHKLRQQLKRRDEMILEMQDQIMELQNSLSSQISHSTSLQSPLDAMNQDLFDSEREIQRLRKSIADHCGGQVSSPNETVRAAPIWPSVGMNGHVVMPMDATTMRASWIHWRKKEAPLIRSRCCVGSHPVERLFTTVLQGTEGSMSRKIKELLLILNSQLPSIL